VMIVTGPGSLACGASDAARDSHAVEIRHDAADDGASDDEATSTRSTRARRRFPTR
jgi:hypothetical protein